MRISAAVLATFFAVTTSQILKSRNEYLSLVGGTIYVSPTEEPIRNVLVFINDGKIAGVGTRGQEDR